MKILWWSNARWANTGYGTQTNIIVPRLKKLGYEVICGSFWGLQGQRIRDPDGILTLPAGREAWGNDVLAADAEHHKVDIVITFMDVWILAAEVVKQFRWCPLLPVDHDPLPPDVGKMLKHAYQPIAYSRFGKTKMQEAGLEPLYIPHGIDCTTFRPMDRAAAREAVGFPPDRFIVGIVAANVGNPGRKCFDQQIRAFAKFREGRPEAMLYLHTETACPVGEDIDHIVRLAGIPSDAIAAVDQYNYRRYMIDTKTMAQVYNSLDVLLNATRGEGFGLPILEAQACGTPVIVTNFTSMPELAFAGWKVAWTEDNKHFTPQRSYQVIPPVSGIVKMLRKAYLARNDEGLRHAAREGALRYEADRITERYWKLALEGLEQRIANEAVSGDPVPGKPGGALRVKMDALSAALASHPATASQFQITLAKWPNRADALWPAGPPFFLAQAAARNGLLDDCLNGHDLVLWIDADLVEYPPDLALRLWDANPDGITAPMVLLEGSAQFYDTYGFIEEGERISHLPPYFTSKQALVPLDAVGCCYLAPAGLYQDVRYGPTRGRTEHWRVMQEAQAQGLYSLHAGYSREARQLGALWTTVALMDSIRKLATTTASTKRPPAVADGKRGARATNLSGLSIVPLMPVSAQTLQRMGMEGEAVEKWETFVTSHAHTDSSVAVTQLPDIVQGDTLVINSDSYVVIAVADWPATRESSAFRQIVVEEPKP